MHISLVASLAIAVFDESDTGNHTPRLSVDSETSLCITFVSDLVADYLTRKNNGIRETEMRLLVLLPAMVIAPAGLICYGETAAKLGNSETGSDIWLVSQ